MVPESFIPILPAAAAEEPAPILVHHQALVVGRVLPFKGA
jgi:hypothetical protein